MASTELVPSRTALCAACSATIPSDADPCPECGVGSYLDGRYRLHREIGRGAMGTTYQATRLSDGADVAVKELLVRRLDSFKSEERFHREARMLEGLDHPGIPRHHDELVAGAGRNTGFYLVTELIDGETLAAEAARRRYDERAVLGVLDELLDVLVYLHARRPPVVHRDLKPANIMRRASDGRLFLVDFGAVREAVADGFPGSTIAGTFGYMPPEQLAGRVTPASDLYALGVIAVELLSRQSPQDLLDARNTLQWRPAVRVQPGFQALLERLLEPDPDRRLGDAEQARAAVRALLDGRQPRFAIATTSRALAPARGTGLLAPPPPSPRPLPTAFLARSAPASYFLMLFGALFGGIGSAVPLLLTFLFLALGLEGGLVFTLPFVAFFGGIGGAVFAAGWRKRALYRRLYQHGDWTVGQVLSVRRTSRLRVNGQHPWEVRYSYVVDGRPYKGRVLRWTPIEHADEGDEISVLYMPGDPATSLVYPLGGERHISGPRG